MASHKEIDRITKLVSERFRCFGGGIVRDKGNPLAYWTENEPAQFALGVDVAAVVACVLDESAKARRKRKRRTKR